jgi:threonyl-tRNA synthetase
MYDHRKLGRELELFHSVPLVGAGLPIWLPDGAAARHAVESYIREAERRAGYRHVYSPPLAKREMYEKSGHLDHFGDDMFPGLPDGADDELYLRPSLCPHHAMVFAARGRSYRELPLRIAELGPMYRAERSGVLGGLARVRAISLNDAHIFCPPEQAVDEIVEVLRMIGRAHAALGIPDARFRLSLRDDAVPAAAGAAAPAVPAAAGAAAPAVKKFVDAPAAWAQAESALRKALRVAGIDYHDAPGEAAFYGPKIDVQVPDAAGREWSLSTVQLDFHQPARFGLSYIDADGARKAPVMVHRSIVGSLERLFAHLIEVHGGAFPAWYAPVQVIAVPVGEAQAAAARAFVDACVLAGLRAEARYDGSVGLRIREAAGRRVPFVAVIGEREVVDGAVSLRDRDGNQLPALPVRSAVAHLGEVARVPV